MTRISCATSLITLVAALGACGSAMRGGTAHACTIAAADSALLAAGPLYRDCSVDRPARAVQTPLQATTSLRPRGPATCYAAEVQFVVGTDGYPEPGTERIVRSTDVAFSALVLASVPTWIYAPAELDGEPVRQIVRERHRIAAVVAVSVGGQPTGSGRASIPAECR
jgi:hypothetical protein